MTDTEVLAVEGEFASGDALEFSGLYEAEFLGVVCNRGAVRMQGVP